MLTLLLISMLTLAFNIQPVKSDWTWTETVYIRADGSIDPPTAPISTTDNVTYTLTGNITSDVDGIIIERDNIIVDGAGYTVQGAGAHEYKGISLSGRSNVTIKSMKIEAFDCGIFLYHSSGSTISKNNVTNNSRGISFGSSDNNSICGNNIANNWDGIYLGSSSNNSVIGNTVTNNGYGITLEYSSINNCIRGNNITNNEWWGINLYDSSSNNSIAGNNVTNNEEDGISLDMSSSNNSIRGNNVASNTYGIRLWYSPNNIVSKNNVTSNWYGIYLRQSSNSIFYHNDFVNNLHQVCMHAPDPGETSSINAWDDGYPSGGNYWSDYTGVDADGDGIGDTPYVIDENNTDRYPLMNPWGSGTPVASFSWSPSTPEVDELVTFDASASMPVGGEIVSYEWDFGDGNHATGEIVTHAYGSAGTFTVTLNVIDSEGLWDIEQKQIEVKAPPPPLTVSISPTSASILVGESVTFTSTVSGGYIPYTYQWYLNGNPVSGANESSWTFTPTTSGIYYVHLKVTDAKGNTTQSETARITVSAVPVGGYSVSLTKPVVKTPLICYTIILAMFITAISLIRRKRK